ncbi:MAG: Uma2 family endonuclease [Geothrix sp.]|nr:Uma2 family endonuclease [Geothrix sp.]
MNLPHPQHPGYTIEDWSQWDGRWELIRGVAYDMTPAPSTEHQRISMALASRIFAALDEAKRSGGGGDCQVFAAPTDVFLESGVVQPDLLIVCDPAKISPRGIEGAPDLVVEILSPTTGQKDLTTKRWLYEFAGAPEYLLVYPEERRAERLTLGPDRIYQTTARTEWGGILNLLGGRVSVTLA